MSRAAGRRPRPARLRHVRTQAPPRPTGLLISISSGRHSPLLSLPQPRQGSGKQLQRGRCARVLVDGRDQLRCSALGPVSFGSVPIRAANGRAFMANVGADKARRQASQHQSVMRVGVHPTAAACHYYMRRDGVLRRMLVRAGHFTGAVRAALADRALLSSQRGRYDLRGRRSHATSAVARL